MSFHCVMAGAYVPALDSLRQRESTPLIDPGYSHCHAEGRAVAGGEGRFAVDSQGDLVIATSSEL
jgi:hypothetical protein